MIKLTLPSLLMLLLATGLSFSQEHQHTPPIPVPQSIDITSASLAGLPRVSVSVMDEHDKSKHTYEGVPLSEVLKKGAIDADKPLHGKDLLKYLVISAKDGYAVVFSLAEVNMTFRDRKILLADKMDGSSLGAEQGPVKLIVPDEAHPSRSVRMVTRLTLRVAEN